MPLARQGRDGATAARLLRPYESEAMEVAEANPAVGNIRNNGPEMMRAVANAAESGNCPCRLPSRPACIVRVDRLTPGRGRLDGGDPHPQC